MAERNTSPPITVASLRAIREKKRQLVAQPPPSPFELTHRLRDAQPPIREAIEETSGPSKYTRHKLATDAVIKQEDVEPADPYEYTHNVLKGRLTEKQDEDNIKATNDLEDFQRSTFTEYWYVFGDLPKVEDIRMIITALYRINEPTGLSKKGANAFRHKKRLGLFLLEDVVAQGLQNEGLVTTATPSEHARSMLLRPDLITMASVQALGQQIKQTNKAQKKVSKLLRARERRQAASYLDDWLEGGVQEDVRMMHTQAHQSDAEDTLESNPAHDASESASRGVVLGKRSASTPLHPDDRSYAGGLSSSVQPELDDVVAADADPSLVAMWQVIPDLQQDAMQDIKTQIIVPTVVEYLDIVKRRRLGTLATAHDTNTDYGPQQSQPAVVAQTLAKHSASSSSPSSFRIERFLMGIRNGTLTEEKVPSNFSIKTQVDNGDTAIHASVRTDAYVTIFKALNALNSLDRDMNKAEHSKANGIKGRWTCLFKKALNEICKWPAEGDAGQYACDYCMRRRRPCIIAIKGVFSVAPLAPSLRVGRGLGDRDYCVLPGGAVVKRNFFS
ncbi:uncharacterized protein J4E88_007962 [Alternaria novae-zelandiae]|uniref:uncharacterized protein n=1 Tax=Alternaria novae-zelandiae TaxID=430562 RepID=UPI0020C3F840|nr:uncharacterized protein J4E88_007962 [Alternaria novae-zelandiae]KAI4675058.1 hypothetical protein J4E88_007962 [Alternaria novae-zelandiae]